MWSNYRDYFSFTLIQYFTELRSSLVSSQPLETQQAMHLCFENLMEGIERNLLTKNRDRWALRRLSHEGLELLVNTHSEQECCVSMHSCFFFFFNWHYFEYLEVD